VDLKLGLVMEVIILPFLNLFIKMEKKVHHMILVYNMKLVLQKVTKDLVKEEIFHVVLKIPVELVVLSQLMEDSVQDLINILMLPLLNMDKLLELNT
jgi:hypothetical protein